MQLPSRVGITLVTSAAMALSACTSTAPSPGSGVANSAPSPSALPTVMATTTAQPTQSPAAAPTATASATETRHSDQFQPAFSYQAPSEWMKFEEGDDYYVLGAGTPDAIVMHSNPVLASDANDCEGLAVSGATSSVEAMSSGIANDPRLDSSDPVPVSIGGFDGLQIDIQLDSEWTGTCNFSDGKPAALILTVADPPGPVFGLQASERARLILLDIGADAIAISIGAADGSAFDDLLPVAMPIVESLHFTPR